MNIVVLISGSGTNLQAIMDAVEGGKIQGNLAAVISNRPDAKGLIRARERGVETLVVDHTSYGTREAFDADLLQAIEHYQPDLVVLAGFMRILTDHFVDHFSGRMLNIHPSLLPEFKGLNTHQRALDAGATEHGCSVHFVSSELDSGAVIGQAKVPVEANDTAQSLSEKVQQQEHRLYPACVALFCSNAIRLSADGVLYQGSLLPATGLDLTED
ncbi:phosphoribosylglycinamide formyltransferase [Ketobacter sp.]|uniref:phosphoribosylglycinamide formyltransferase n=1 Tax=Ketobacter sp. TaxID=2083498 RepID=UPI000F1CAACE|nr:phosphoribosylglycinamide formyltransferase [Ketobacter sp.]RLU01551.1 MAG: phosphoribosylglycinamide formyltransferase [Ketobacter sp.]